MSAKTAAVYSTTRTPIGKGLGVTGVKPMLNGTATAKSPSVSEKIKETASSPIPPKPTVPESQQNGVSHERESTTPPPTATPVSNGHQFTKADIARQEELLKSQLQANIQFIEKLFGSTEKQTGEIRELNNKLKAEQDAKQKAVDERQKAVEKLEQSEEKTQRFDVDVKRLNLEVKNLQVELDQVSQDSQKKIKRLNDDYQQQLAAKDQQIEELQKAAELLRQETEEKLKRMKAETEQQIVDMKHGMEDLEDMLLGFKHMQNTVDSFHVGAGILEEPCGAFMLPNGNVVVADTLKGLFLFTSFGVLKKNVSSELWKWPQGLVYDPEKARLIVSLIRKDEKTGKWSRALGFFTTTLEETNFIEGPSIEHGFDNVAKECLAMSANGDFYISVSDKVGSGLWKLIAGNWEMVTTRPGSLYTDTAVLSTGAAITDLLVIESKMGYLNRFSIRDHQLVERRTLAVVPKPNAICVDELGNVFVHDIESGKIYMCDRHTLDTQRDICVVDDAVFSLTAAHGYLGVAVRKGKLVQIFKYTSDIYTMETARSRKQK